MGLWPLRINCCANRRADARLERDFLAHHAVARGLAGFLRVHAKLEHVQQHLDVALGLHAAAHHAEAQPGLAVFITIAGMIVWYGRLRPAI